MAGRAVNLCAQMNVNPELARRFSSAAGKLSCSGRSDSSRGTLSSWAGSGGFWDFSGRTCTSLHGFRGNGTKARSRGRGSGGRGWRRSAVVVCAGGDKKDGKMGDDGVETLFMKELRRRGMSEKAKDGAPLSAAGTDTKTKEESEGGGSFFRGWSLPGSARTKPPPELTESQRDEQLKRSQALNSEGLDGLIPRGTELLKLGSSIFLVFWPFILASVAAFAALYLYFGPGFIHTGNSYEAAKTPPYVNPYQLLEEEAIPPSIGPNRVPFNTRPDDSMLDTNFP